MTLQNKVHRNEISFEGRLKQRDMKEERIKNELLQNELQLHKLKLKINHQERELDHIRRINNLHNRTNSSSETKDRRPERNCSNEMSCLLSGKLVSPLGTTQNNTNRSSLLVN